MYATISADVVSSTSLSQKSMLKLNDHIKKCLVILEDRYSKFWGRIVRGDTIECVLPSPENALEVALILKTWVKSFTPEDKAKDSFNKYGLRIAIGLGDMKTVNRERDMMDGDAIYKSGRALDSLVGRLKYSFTISMANKEQEEILKIMFSLINDLVNTTTARRCRTLCEKILYKDTSLIAKNMGITESGVNQNLNALCWTSIEQVIEYYKKTILSIILKGYFVFIPFAFYMSSFRLS